MGFIITINAHLDVEIRKESFIIHDDELPIESPEFRFERVFPFQAAIQQIIESPRFQRWLEEKERSTR